MRLSMTGNLPAESNAFIGRERDLVDLGRILGHARAVTLCGPGGIGKTRLALRLADSLAAGYPDGLWIADLAESEDPLVPLVAAALGVRAEPDRPLAETFLEALQPRTMLLILDTCEQRVADCAAFAEWLLGSCPGLRIIATSAEPLRSRAEVIWRVPPLGLPPAARLAAADVITDEVADCEAVRLFAARAAAVRPDFALTSANAAAVAEICRTLDGVPLAIELAAARLGTLSAEQIQHRLSSRFELLARGDRTAPPRQQTLRATVDWSYDLLTSPERQLLTRLSVFRGWSLEMAERVCADEVIGSADVLGLLTALIDKSLVNVERHAQGTVRYGMLGTVRQFAADHVTNAAESSRLRAAHRDCMLALADDIERRALLLDEPSWQERVDTYQRAMADLANFQLALGYCADRGDAEGGLRLCTFMRISWLTSGDQSGVGWLDRFLGNAATVSPGLASRALVVRSEMAFEQQDYAASDQYASAALEVSLACTDGNLAGALRMKALGALMSGRAADGLTDIEASIAAARKAADGWEEGVSLATKAALVIGSGDLDGGHLAYEQALTALGQGRGWGVANVNYGLARLALQRDDRAEALRCFTVALGLYRQVGARPQMARCLAGIGQLALDAGDLPKARESMTECVRLSLVTGQRLAIARGLAALAGLAAASGDLAAAVRLAGTARTLFEAIGTPQASALRRVDDLVGAARLELGTQVVTALLAEGNGMSPHQAAAQATLGPAAEADRPDRELWPAMLTEREQEVALLVAEGLSNRVIGDKLFISQATAARHVANIFDKLGFTSRTQLIAWVVTTHQAR